MKNSSKESILSNELNLDWRIATPDERLKTGFTRDPITAYIGYPDIQRQILKDEAVETWQDSDLWPQKEVGRLAIEAPQ